MADLIITLGRGIKEDGSLPPDPISRVHKAVELFRTGVADTILMSGASSFHHDLDPSLSEAEEMKKVAMGLGVKAKSILVESKSLDTLGNVLFSKQKICMPRKWTDLVVVASDEHMPRVQYLFLKIFGPDYDLSFEESEKVIDDEKYASEVVHESKSFKTIKEWLDPIRDGDHEAVWKLMKEHHPAYKNFVESD